MTAYVVMIQNSITDPVEFKQYQGMAGAARDGHAMTPLAFYGTADTLEGDKVGGAVILSFPTMAEARAWYDSPVYQEALQHRLKGADYRVFIVEGL